MNIYHPSLKDRQLPELKFGFDIDDVVGGLTGIIMDEINLLHGTNYSVKDIKNRDFFSNYGNGDPDYLKNLIISSGMYEKMKPIAETIKFINLIKDKFQVSYVTARFSYPGIEQVTKTWFDMNDIHYDSIHFEKYKSYFTKILGIDYFLDDSLENAIKITKNSKTKVFLLKTPWNGKDEVERLINKGILTREQIEEGMKHITTVNTAMEITNFPQIKNKIGGEIIKCHPVFPKFNL